MTTDLMLAYDKYGEHLTYRSHCCSISLVGRTPCLRREVENLGATRKPAHHKPKQESVMLECAEYARRLSQGERMLGVDEGDAVCRRATAKSATVLLWISVRADGARRVRLAHVPKCGGRIRNFLSWGRSVITRSTRKLPRAEERWQNDVRLLVFAAFAARAKDVRFITVPKCV
jgi:hypothetical protein